MEYAVGDKVLLSTQNIPLKGIGTKKLCAKYIGPFEVLERIGLAAYKLQLPEHFKTHNVLNVDLLKAWHSNGTYQPPPTSLLVEDEEEYVIEEILDHRPKGTKRSDSKSQFLIKWEGYGSENNIWEPRSHLRHAPESLKEYWTKVAVRATKPRRGAAGRLAPVSKRMKR